MVDFIPLDRNSKINGLSEMAVTHSHTDDNGRNHLLRADHDLQYSPTAACHVSSYLSSVLPACQLDYIKYFNYKGGCQNGVVNSCELR